MTDLDVAGKITVYECSDGGTGDPAKTTWQFFVGEKAVITKSHFLAEAVRLALHMGRDVKVQVVSGTNNTLTQVRIACS
jgi:hypothetical protein